MVLLSKLLLLLTSDFPNRMNHVWFRFGLALRGRRRAGVIEIPFHVLDADAGVHLLSFKLLQLVHLSGKMPFLETDRVRKILQRYRSGRPDMMITGATASHLLTLFIFHSFIIQLLFRHRSPVFIPQGSQDVIFQSNMSTPLQFM